MQWIKKYRWLLENISKHWVSIFTWRKMVIHQLETDGKYTNMETLVNVLNSLWLYCWWLGAIWGLISNSVSLSISLSADVPEPWFFPFLFHFPEIECCWAGWEICVEVQQAEKLRRALCAGRGDTNAAQGDQTHRAWDGHCSSWMYSHTFLQQHLTAVFPHQQKSHTSPSFNSVPNICKKLGQSNEDILHSTKINDWKIPNRQAILTEINPLGSAEPIEVLPMWCTFHLQSLRRKLYQNRLLTYIFVGNNERCISC